MPPVREIDTSDGLRVVMLDGTVFRETAAQMQGRLASYPGNLKKKEESYNNWLQSQDTFQRNYPIGEFDLDHQVHTDPDNLPPWRIVTGPYVVEIIMWIAVHFYSSDPLDFIPRCQDKELDPITGEWW